MTDRQFLQAVVASPLFDFALRDARDVVGQVLSLERPGTIAISDAARQDMQSAYAERVRDLYLSAVTEQLLRETMEFKSSAMAQPRNLDEDDVHLAERRILESRGDDIPGALKERLPVIDRYERHIRKNYVQAMAEFLRNLGASAEEVSEQLLAGTPLASVERLNISAGDMHRHGRTVIGVTSDAGTVYYKPRACTLDLMYHELVERHFADCTVAAACVAKDGFGFVSELKAMPLSGPEELPRYFRNLGVLTALFRGIGTSDMHSGNVLPCGTRPAIVDLETLMKPDAQAQEAGRDEPDGAASIAAAFTESVLATGMMPVLIPNLGLASPLFRSGADTHLPLVGTTRHSVQGFEDAYLEGFSQGLARLIACRDEIEGLLTSNAGAEVRYIPQNTSYYAFMLQQLYRGRFLASTAAQDEGFDLLGAPYRASGREVPTGIVDHERRCLSEGDVPYFCCTLDGRDLCGNDPRDVVSPSCFSRSASERARALLKGLDEESGRFDLDLMHALFQTIPHPRQGAQSQKHEGERKVQALRQASGPDKDPAWWRPLIEHVNDCLVDQRLRVRSGDVLWYSRMHELYSFADAGSFAVVAGVAHYAALLKGWDGEATGTPEVTSLAEQGLGTLATLLEGELRGAPLGFDGGMAQILMDLDRAVAAKLKGADEARALLLRRLSEDSASLCADAGATGLAELVIALSRSDTTSPWQAQLTRRYAHGLAERPSPSPETPIREKASLAAGLACAAQALGSRACADASKRLFSEVRDGYREDLVGWPSEEARFAWLAPRGTQSPWVGLCSLVALGALDPSRHEDTLEEELLGLSVRSVVFERELRDNDSLYHGNALAVLLLTAYGTSRHDDGALAHAGSRLCALYGRMRQQGELAICPPDRHDVFDAHFCRGTVGIATAAIRWLMATQSLDQQMTRR